MPLPAFSPGVPSAGSAVHAAATVTTIATAARTIFAIPVSFSLCSCEARRQIVVSAHVGQTEIPSLGEIREPFVVDAEKAQPSGVQIVDVNSVLDRPQPDVIRRPDHLAALDAAAGHPDAEAVGVVIPPAADAPVGVAVRHRRAAEF